MRVGVDFGRVITETAAPPNNNYLSVAPRPMALETIKVFKAAGFSPVVISKADSETKEQKARHYLEHHRFTHVLGESALHFCRRIEDKADLCRLLDVDLFFDDSEEQLEIVKPVVEYPILFGAESSENFEVVKNWHGADHRAMQVAQILKRMKL